MSACVTYIPGCLFSTYLQFMCIYVDMYVCCCNMGTGALPDIYARSSGAEGIHTYLTKY